MAMRGVAAFVIGVYAGVIIANPIVQREIKKGASTLINYTKGQINDNFHNKEVNKEETSYETEKPLET